jgi:glycine betaine/proline transport system permease protein
MFPDFMTIPLADWVNSGIDWVVVNYGDYFEAFANGLLVVLVGLEQFLRQLPWWSVVLTVSFIGWHARRPPGTLRSLLSRILRMRRPEAWRALNEPGAKVRMIQATLTGVWRVIRRPGLGFGLALVMTGIGVLGLWDKAMQTLALMLVATAISVLIGVPLGIVMSRSDRFRSVLLPVLDAMQTMPSFVYLIPALLLFGLGKVPAIFATVIYAVVPVTRLTDLGIRLVDREVIEAAESFGATSRQQLFGVYLPLALPNIMAGINQTTMMALSMVVVASMIGARGLGEEVLLGIQRLDVGRGAAAGLAIVFLAIAMDRITQSYGKRSEIHRTKTH